jgi:hypothetical protein
MYSIEGYELGMAYIVFTLYIVGKVWMYYRIEDKDTPTKKPKRIKSGRKSRLIKRGPEWPE